MEVQTTKTLTNTHLMTFDNQISGHSCLLKPSTTSKSILKPYNRNEADFYELVTHKTGCPIVQFIPAYYGLLLLPARLMENMAHEILRDSSPSDESEDSKESEGSMTEVGEAIETSSEVQSESAKETPSSCLQSKSNFVKNLFATRFDQKNDCNSFMIFLFY